MKKYILTFVFLALAGTAAAQTPAASGKKYQVRTRVTTADSLRLAVRYFDLAIGVMDSVYSAKIKALEKKIQRVSTTANTAAENAASALATAQTASGAIDGLSPRVSELETRVETVADTARMAHANASLALRLARAQAAVDSLQNCAIDALIGARKVKGGVEGARKAYDAWLAGEALAIQLAAKAEKERLAAEKP